MGMGIGQFARLSGVPIHTLKRLHDSGKLVASEVTERGHRRYDEWQLEDAERFVRRMRLLRAACWRRQDSWLSLALATSCMPVAASA